jgi:predicted amidohydrolase YtcJ
MARDDQLDRMAALGVIPSFFSLHTYYWGDRHRDIFMGPERAARMSPAKSAADRGLRFTIHCDAPVVPMEPLRLVWAAVNRRSTSGAQIGTEERIDVMRALRAVTIDAAYQHFEEREKGSLEPGKLADLVILSGSPLDDPAQIDSLRVVETIIGGRSVYSDGG